MSDSPLIDSLVAAVEARPDDLPLRLHLAELLVGAGRGSEAGGHAAQGLAREPGNAAARRLMTVALGGPGAPSEEPPGGDVAVGGADVAYESSEKPPTQGDSIDWAAMEEDLGDIVPPRFARA